jgi:DNA-directed RNA polymerase specialized sigma24 family protein
MLRVLVDRAPAAFTEAQWATLSRLRRTTGTWRNYKSLLRTRGYAQQDAAGHWSATDQAVADFGSSSPAETVEEIREKWKRAIGGTPSRMLDFLVDHYPGGLGREELAELAGISPTTGTFRNYLSVLRTNGLVEDEGGVLTASSLVVNG